LADNIAITAGVGTTVGTDDVGGVHYQMVKLVNGTLDSATPIPGSANGLFVQGQAATDAAVAGNPLVVAGKALGEVAATTDVGTAGDVVPLLATPGGIQYVALRHPNRWQLCVTGSGALTDSVIHADPGASVALYITDIILSSITAQTWLFEDGDNTAISGIFYTGANGILVAHFVNPIKVTVHKSLTLTTTAAVAHTAQVQGFIAA